MKAYNVWGEREGSFVWLTSSTNLATDTGPVVCRAALPLQTSFKTSHLIQLLWVGVRCKKHSRNQFSVVELRPHSGALFSLSHPVNLIRGQDGRHDGGRRERRSPPPSGRLRLRRPGDDGRAAEPHGGQPAEGAGAAAAGGLASRRRGAGRADVS